MIGIRLYYRKKQTKILLLILCSCVLAFVATNEMVNKEFRYKIFLEISSQIYSNEPIPKEYRLKSKFPIKCSSQYTIYYDHLNTTDERQRIAHFLDGPVRFSHFFVRFDKVIMYVWNASKVIVTADPFFFAAPVNWTEEIHVQISKNRRVLIGPIVAHIVDGISVGIGTQFAYGHMMRDGIIPLQFIPQSVLNNSVFICNKVYIQYLKEIIPLYGCKEPAMICNIEGSECVYVEHLFCVTPKHYRMGVSGIHHNRNFVQILKKAAGTANTTATRYVLTNRGYGMPRYIIGFDFMVSKVKKKWPKIDWYIYLSPEQSVVKQCAFWSTVKFVFGPCGSNLFNIIFMNENGVVVYMRDPMYADAGNNVAAVVANLWVLSVPYHGWENKHFDVDKSKTPINICLALEYIGHGLYVLENQEWPTDFSIKRKETPLDNKYGVTKFNESEIPIYNELYWPELKKSKCNIIQIFIGPK